MMHLLIAQATETTANAWTWPMAATAIAGIAGGAWVAVVAIRALLLAR